MAFSFFSIASAIAGFNTRNNVEGEKAIFGLKFSHLRFDSFTGVGKSATIYYNFMISQKTRFQLVFGHNYLKKLGKIKVFKLFFMIV